MKPIVAILLLGSATTVFGQAPAKAPLPPETDYSHDGWYAELPPALAEAKRTGKDLLIDFGGSDWCAPCKWLKQGVFLKPEFTAKAAQNFVLVDIDALARGLSPERKARYVKWQKQYRVLTFPSVFLTTPDGEPYAWTTYIPATESSALDAVVAAVKLDSPERFWAQIEPLIARGRIFRESLAKAKSLTGSARADALIEGYAQVRADFLLWYYPERVAELRALDPADGRGFLAYLDGCKAYGDLEDKIGGGYELNPQVKIADVEALIAQHRLTGETLQQALAMKATLQVLDGQPLAALESIGAFVAAHASRGPYDRGDYMPISAAGLAQLSKRVAEGTANKEDVAAQYLALHRVFEGQELPNRYRVSCHATEGSAFQPIIAVRKPIGEAYGKAVLAATSSLEGEARARALGKALEDTQFLNDGPIRTIVNQTIPNLVGREKAADYLPKNYQAWVRPPQRRPASDAK